MEERTRTALVVAGTVGLFLAVQVAALALAGDFYARGYQATGDAGDPTNSLVYVLAVLVVTGAVLLALRLGVGALIRAVVVLTGGLLSWYVFGALVPRLLGGVLSPGALFAVATGAALAIVVGLVVHPEWYVLDAAGVVMGAGAAGMFGISFGLLPALVLLVVLAVYDAVSVYATEHMLDLAEGMMDLKIPVVLIVPATLSFSYLALIEGDESPMDGVGDPAGSAGGVDTDGPGESGADVDAEGADESGPDTADDRVLGHDALFVGLGDAVVPTVLVVSAGFFLRDVAPPLVEGFALNVPALGALLGTVAGLLALLRLVLEGRPHAGLPLLNGGTILGYLAGAVVAGVPLTVALGL